MVGEAQILEMEKNGTEMEKIKMFAHHPPCPLSVFAKLSIAMNEWDETGSMRLSVK